MNPWGHGVKRKIMSVVKKIRKREKDEYQGALRLSRRIHEDSQNLCFRLNISRAALIEDMLRDWVDRNGEGDIPKIGEKTITRNSTVLTVPPSGNYVVESLQRHLHDPDCRACLQALAKIWDSGDSEIRHAITANCQVFARAVEAIHGVQHGEIVDTPGDNERERVAGLLASEDGVEKPHNAGEKAARDSAGGRKRARSVGGKTAKGD